LRLKNQKSDFSVAKLANKKNGDRLWMGKKKWLAHPIGYGCKAYALPETSQKKNPR
jgi:hypothetical protein